MGKAREVFAGYRVTRHRGSHQQGRLNEGFSRWPEHLLFARENPLNKYRGRCNLHSTGGEESVKAKVANHYPSHGEDSLAGVERGRKRVGITFAAALALPSQPPRATVKHLYSLVSIPTRSTEKIGHTGSSTPHGRIHEDSHRSALCPRLRRIGARAVYHGPAPHPR